MRKLLPVLALLTCALPARANVAHVQDTFIDCNGSASCAKAFASNVTNGNTIYFVGSSGSGGGTGAAPTINTPTDSGGNTFTCQTQVPFSSGTVGNAAGRVCCAPVTQSTGADTVTGTIGSALDFGFTIFEASGGTCTTDGAASGTTTSSATVTSASYSTTNANDIILAVAADDNDCNTWTAGTTGGVAMTLTSGTGNSCLSIGWQMEYLVVSSTQSSVTTSITGSHSGEKYLLVAQAYKAASGGGTTATPTQMMQGVGSLLFRNPFGVLH